MMHEAFTADRRLIQALLKNAQPAPCEEGRTLFNQGETPQGLYILEHGEAVLVMKSADGRTVQCMHAGSGSLLGLPALIAKQPYTLTAIVRKGSEVKFVTPKNFVRTIEDEPGLYPSVLEMLAAEVRYARQAFAEK